MSLQYTSKRLFQQTIRTQHRQFATTVRMSAQQNEKGQGASHATDSSVPEGLQKKVPESVEHQLPDSVHDTGANEQTGKVSHATGPKGSKVPQVCSILFFFLKRPD